MKLFDRTRPVLSSSHCQSMAVQPTPISSDFIPVRQSVKNLSNDLDLSLNGFFQTREGCDLMYILWACSLAIGPRGYVQQLENILHCETSNKRATIL